MKRRDDLKNEHPNFNATDITEKLGQEWRSLTEKERSNYQEEFTKNYESYKVELETYFKQKGIDPIMEKIEKKKVCLA